MRLLRPSPLLAIFALLCGGAMLLNGPGVSAADSHQHQQVDQCALIVMTAAGQPFANHVLMMVHENTEQRLKFVTDAKGCVLAESLAVGTWHVSEWASAGSDRPAAAIEVKADAETPLLVVLPAE